MCVLHQYITGSSFKKRWLTSTRRHLLRILVAKKVIIRVVQFALIAISFCLKRQMIKNDEIQSWREMTGKVKSSKDQVVKSYLRPFVASLFLRPSFLAEDSFIATNEVFFNNNWNIFIFSAFQCRKEAVYFLKIKIALCIGNPTATRSSLRSCPLPIIPLCPSREEGVIFFCLSPRPPLKKKNAWSQVKLGPASLHMRITLNQKRMAVFKLEDALSVLVYGRFYAKDALSVWTNLCKHL